MVKSLFLIVVKSNNNRFMPEWEPGDPVRRIAGTYSGDSFDLALSDCVECYTSRKAADFEITLRNGSFVGVDFEVIEFREG